MEYRAELVELADGVTDVRVLPPDGKSWSMWGRKGAAREEALAASLPEGRLPVLLGSGLGRCLELLLERGPVAVLDAETPVLEATGVRERFGGREDVLWLEERDPQAAAERILAWRDEHGGAELEVIPFPLYRRLDPALYPAVERLLASGGKPDGEALFWENARRPRFRDAKARVLILSTPYFLYREIRRGFERLGVETLDLEVGGGDTIRQGFVEELLRQVLSFGPDFVLTVNHLGVDREGAITGLLDKLSLPLASWFVDSPHLILHRYQGLAGKGTAVFTWDADSARPLRDMGFALVRHLPLATDEHVFRPGLPGLQSSLCSDTGFVGDSMVSKAAERLAHADPPGVLRRDYRELARGFAEAEESAPTEYLRRFHPAHAEAFEALPSLERKLSYEALITWEATRLYRLGCVRRLAPFDAMVAGDEHWREALPAGGRFRLAGRLDYYRDLPRFYPGVRVNLNCTSRQMKSAVNQRVFDIPACGGFVLTDRQGQLDRLFEPGREIAVYGHPDEIEGLARHYLANESERLRIIEAGRSRVLAEHTYERRLERLLQDMRANFG